MKGLFLSVSLFLLLLITACSIPSPEDTLPPPVAVTTTTPAGTMETSEPAVTDETIPATTAALHSTLYLPGVPVEDVICYFNEVVLNAEFVNSGSPAYLQRWEEPIQYAIYGNPTDEDLATFSAFLQWLNQLEGFPGIFEATDPNQENLSIYFCSESELIDRLGDNFYGTDGGVTFWYTNNKIFQAIICCRTDLDQQLRNSVILEELYNGLGPVQDTELRSDSIIYSGFTQPQQLTQIDELLLKLLYHPLMQCGMDADACETVIRQLYY